MKIPLFDLSRMIKDHKKNILDDLCGTMNDCQFINGPEIGYLEKRLEAYTNINKFVCVSSGTDALLAIFMSLDIEKGSEILLSPFTFISSATSIIRAGFVPVFVDVADGFFHPSVEDYKKAITPKTKGLLTIHLFGEPNDMDKLSDFCKNNSLLLIEDCAQSMGSKWRDRHVGSFGDASAFSFFPAKNLGCFGDGGAAATNNEELAEKLKIIKSHGARRKYNTELLGGNFRLDTIQAVVLNNLLNSLNDWVEKRIENASYYINNLKESPFFKKPNLVQGHSWNQFTLVTPYRNELKSFLDENLIGNAIYYPKPLHTQPLFSSYSVKLPRVERLCNQVISIPIYPGLEKEERQKIVEKINYFMEKK